MLLLLCFFFSHLLVFYLVDFVRVVNVVAGVFSFFFLCVVVRVDLDVICRSWDFQLLRDSSTNQAAELKAVAAIEAALKVRMYAAKYKWTFEDMAIAIASHMKDKWHNQKRKFDVVSQNPEAYDYLRTLTDYLIILYC